MKRNAIPVLAGLWLWPVTAAMRPFRFEDGDLVLDFKNPDGWRFYRRPQRVESFQSDD